MKAVWTDRGRLDVRDEPIPHPPHGWALIEMVEAGICGTDLAVAKGLYDFSGIPGHEFVGIVRRGPTAWKARRVTADINIPCRRCRSCRNGHRKHCRFRRVLGIRGINGAFARYLCVPVANLRAIPDGLDDVAAVFAEPLAAALDARACIIERTRDPVLVVGPGRLGQLVVRVLLADGFRVSCLGRGKASLEHLPSGVETTESLPAAWAGRFKTVVECSGSVEGATLALRALRPRGMAVLKSTCHDQSRLDLSRAVVDELRLVGSRCGDLALALDWLGANRIDPRALITRTAALVDARSAFCDAGRPEHMKVLLRP